MFTPGNSLVISVAKMGGIIMTNLGRLDIPETYGSLRLERMYLAPCAAETVPLILAGVGVGGCLTFTANYVERIDRTSPVGTEKKIRIRNLALEYMGFSDKKTEREIPKSLFSPAR